MMQANLVSVIRIFIQMPVESSKAWADVIQLVIPNRLVVFLLVSMVVWLCPQLPVAFDLSGYLAEETN